MNKYTRAGCQSTRNPGAFISIQIYHVSIDSYKQFGHQLGGSKYSSFHCDHFQLRCYKNFIMLPVTEETDVFTIWIYSSTSGAILAFTVCSLLFLNVAFKYHNVRISGSKTLSSKKISYCMVLLYLMLTSLASLSYAFIRTNAFTRIKNHQFTKYQCTVGYLMSYLSYYLSVGLLFIIFVWRIHITLKESAYGYHPSVIKFLYLVITLMDASFCISIIYNVIKAEWKIVAHDHVSMCINFVSDVDDLAFQIFSYNALFMNIFHLIMNPVLLIMFVKGLWSINRLFIKSLRHVHHNIYIHFFFFALIEFASLITSWLC